MSEGTACPESGRCPSWVPPGRVWMGLLQAVHVALRAPSPSCGMKLWEKGGPGQRLRAIGKSHLGLWEGCLGGSGRNAEPFAEFLEPEENKKNPSHFLLWGMVFSLSPSTGGPNHSWPSKRSSAAACLQRDTDVLTWLGVSVWTVAESVSGLHLQLGHSCGFLFRRSSSTDGYCREGPPATPRPAAAIFPWRRRRRKSWSAWLWWARPARPGLCSARLPR